MYAAGTSRNGTGHEHIAINAWQFAVCPPSTEKGRKTHLDQGKHDATARPLLYQSPSNFSRCIFLNVLGPKRSNYNAGDKLVSKKPVVSSTSLIGHHWYLPILPGFRRPHHVIKGQTACQTPENVCNTTVVGIKHNVVASMGAHVCSDWLDGGDQSGGFDDDDDDDVLHSMHAQQAHHVCLLIIVTIMVFVMKLHHGSCPNHQFRAPTPSMGNGRSS